MVDCKKCIILFDKSKDDIKCYFLEMLISYIKNGRSVHSFNHWQCRKMKMFHIKHLDLILLEKSEGLSHSLYIHRQQSVGTEYSKWSHLPLELGLFIPPQSVSPWRVSETQPSLDSTLFASCLYSKTSILKLVL